MTRRLSIVARTPPEAGAEALALVRALVFGAVPEIEDLLAADTRDAALVDVLDLLPGARLAERRAVQRACREGRIGGAAKIARRWRAPRVSIEAWMRDLGPRVVVPPPAEQDDGLDALRASLARPTRARGRRPG